MCGKSFKVCPTCFTTWDSSDAFLSDSSLELNGYKADFQDLEYGLFFFTHKDGSCFSTMALEVADFLHLYSGQIYPERKNLTAECPQLCTKEKQFGRCDAMCECAFVREIIEIIREKQRKD